MIAPIIVVAWLVMLAAFALSPVLRLVYYVSWAIGAPLIAWFWWWMHTWERR